MWIVPVTRFDKDMPQFFSIFEVTLLYFACQKSRFSSLSACSTEGYESSDIQHCYSSNELYGVNPREPLGGQPTSNEAVSQALCVVQKNTAIPVLIVLLIFCHILILTHAFFLLLCRRNFTAMLKLSPVVFLPLIMAKRRILTWQAQTFL